MAATPAEIVMAFLAAVEARNLPLANSFLADDFRMTFPGPRHFRRIEDLVEAAGRSYRRARKRHQRIDVASTGADTVVHVSGTLYGQWLDGTGFEGIRFIDRFVIRGGKLVEQEVWNDLAVTAVNAMAERGAAAEEKA